MCNHCWKAPSAYKLLESLVEEVERLQHKVELQATGLAKFSQQAGEQQAVIERLRTTLTRVEQMIDIALPRFNWAASALDAEAIQLLNDVPREVKQVLYEG